MSKINIGKLLEKTTEVGEVASKIKIISINNLRASENFYVMEEFIKNESNPSYYNKDIAESLFLFMQSRDLYQNKIEKILKESQILTNLSIEKSQVGDAESVSDCLKNNQKNLVFCQEIVSHLKILNQKFCEKLIADVGSKYKENYEHTEQSPGYKSKCFLLSALYETYVLKKPHHSFLKENFDNIKDNAKEKTIDTPPHDHNSGRS